MLTASKLCRLSVPLLLLMLYGCSSNQPISYEKPEVESPIAEWLLVYCEEPVAIPELPQDATEEQVNQILSEALKTTVRNHGRYSECYGLQRSLVDAVKRRQIKKTPN